ncbi:MAG: SDR family oxidoreductase [Minwuia sp.]|uniref:SDR family oxidoreductase n=1 Tax=Minwuia sp. TaxID=2493630 RepID=UPI003A86CCCD
MTSVRRGPALITGGAKRIGRAIALRLAGDGHPVVIHYNGSADAAEATAGEARASGVAAATVQADLTDHDAVLKILPRAAEAIGAPLEVLVNNASLFENDRISTVTQQSFDRHMAVNLRAPLFLIQQFAAALPEDVQGAVVNLLDMRVWKPLPGFVSYTASRAGLEMLTRTMAMALAPRIRVNAIGPGPVLANERQSEEQFRRQWRSTPLQRGAEPEEIAAAVRFLLDAPAMTGQMIALDGGQHLPWPPEPPGLDG